MELTIVIPTYNEKENIEIFIPKIEKEVLKKRKIKGEIIVVDDNSPDGTARAALKLNKKYKNIRVIIRNKKEGIGAALICGYNAASGRFILSSDSDLSFSTNDMLRLIDKIHSGYDLVVGSRHLTNKDYQKIKLKTFIKGFISKYGNILVRVLSGVNIHDYSANLRIISNDVWRDIKTKEKTNSILLEMILKTAYKGYKVTEIPVKFLDRIYGKSKINLFKEAPKFLIRLIYYVFKYRILRMS